MNSTRQSLTAPGFLGEPGRFRARQRLVVSLGIEIAPDPPTGLTVSVSGGEFDLQWVDNSQNELGFIIEWSLDALTWEVWGTVPSNTTTASIPPTAVTGPPANATVYWRVKAFNNAGESGPSNVESQTVVDSERVSLNKLVPTLIAEETNIQGVELNKFVVTVILDETYP